jgi:hypothetical protein
MGGGDGTPLAVPFASVHPHLSLTILEITLADPRLGFRRLVEELGKRGLKSKAGRRSLAAAGVSDDLYSLDGVEWLADAAYDLEALVIRCDQEPGWASEETPYRNTEFKIVVALRRDTLVAIHTDLSTLKDSLLTWLDRSPPPPFRRVSEGVMHAAFIRGDTKALWLRGTHTRRTTKADTKNLSGRRVDDTLLPHEDSSFAMASARTMLPTNLGLAALAGTLGTTPRNSRIWGAPTSGPADFLAKTNDALSLVDDVLVKGLAVEQPFPLLARREEDLDMVHGAFDFSLLDPDSIAPGINNGVEILESATLLSEASISIDGSSSSSNFTLHVGLNGSLDGAIGGQLIQKRGTVSYSFGFRGEPTNGPPVRRILDALNAHGNELLTIYYESGHTVVDRSLWKRELRALPFPNWEFHDFSGFTIDCEKPDAKGDQAIHDAIARPGDNSLFGWVVRHLARGWLICDDGGGEIADFIHLSDEPDAKLSLIHIKGADTVSLKRQVAVGPYEVVASQATKNVRYLAPEALRNALENPRIERPASWTNGVRVPDRAEFLEMLDYRRSIDPNHVIIIQPHVSELLHTQARIDRERGLDHSRGVLRMSLLEALLNTARSAIVGSGADLYVWGAKL